MSLYSLRIFDCVEPYHGTTTFAGQRAKVDGLTIHGTAAGHSNQRILLLVTNTVATRSFTLNDGTVAMNR